ncbi:hypothetical protein KI387_009425 [Taxus chinensis]|uniref:Pentatricopeptide repeat-containing protein n=1 Tax=Taxus chinensis TaxID=29808 RepID=A0AA38FJD8_TAXCH|nr:hypothetical protein KI387_009425 [Taxus chinensis]
MQKFNRLTIKTCFRPLQESINSKSVKNTHTHLIVNGRMESDILLRWRLFHFGSTADACHMFDKMPEQDDVSSWNRLITGYTKLGKLESAHQLFDKMPARDVVSWAALISGYHKRGRSGDALKLFCQMMQCSVKPNEFIFASTLSTCASIFSINLGKQMHGYIIRTGLESNVFVGSALVDLYAKCESIDDARQVFDEMPERNTVSWATMIGGYARNQFGGEALELFCEMRKVDMKQESSAFASALIACGSLAALVHGKIVHAQIVRTGFHSNFIVENAIVDMYAKCGAMVDAHQMFDRMSARDVVSWTAMIVGYIQNGYSEEALKLFQRVLWTDVKPDPFTFASILSACASLALLELGKQLHAHIIGTGYASSLSVETSLVNVYAKCGSIDVAAQVFDKMVCKNLVSWNAMIAGYAHNGNGKEALQLFEVMLEAGMKPDDVTFLGILSACSHAGLVDVGCHYFDVMRRETNILVTTDHYTCMIDLLGRAGRMSEAEDIVNNMPVKPNAAVWKALLHACRIHGNVELGERAAERLIQWEPEKASTYVLLSHVYATANRWKDAENVRKMMKDGGVKKEAGCSWIQVKGNVYTFFAEDTSHSQSQKI